MNSQSVKAAGRSAVQWLGGVLAGLASSWGYSFFYEEIDPNLQIQHAAAVECMSFIPGTDRLLTSSGDSGRAALWDLQQTFTSFRNTLTPSVRGFMPHKRLYCALASPHSGEVITLGLDGQAALWNPDVIERENGVLVLQQTALFNLSRNGLAEFSDPGMSVTVHPLMNWLMVVSGDNNNVEIWDLSEAATPGSPTLKAVLPHRDSVRAITFRPGADHSSQAVTGTSAGAVFLWDLDDIDYTTKPDSVPVPEAKQLAEIQLGTAVRFFRFDPPGRLLLTLANDDAVARLWDFNRIELADDADEGALPSPVLWAHVVHSSDERPGYGAFSSDSQKLVTTTAEQVRIWDINDVKVNADGDKVLPMLARIKKSPASTNGKSWFPTDNETLFTLGDSENATLWNLTSPLPLDEDRVPAPVRIAQIRFTGPQTAALFSDDQSQLTVLAGRNQGIWSIARFLENSSQGMFKAGISLIAPALMLLSRFIPDH